VDPDWKIRISLETIHQIEMKNFTFPSLLPIALLTIPMQTSWGQNIEGVTIEDVSSELVGGFDRAANYLVDGSGFDESLGTHTVTPDGFMWLNTGTFAAPNDPNVPGAIITFDLEANYDLGSLTVWNYNETLPGRADLLNRGTNEVEILIAASEGGEFTSIGDFVFEIAPGLDLEDFGQIIDLSTIPEATNARLVRFNIKSNHGGDNNFVGLSEVRFTGAGSPVVLSTASFSTSANQGTPIGDLSTPSGDAGDTFNYELVAGDGDTDNGKFQIAGDQLQIGPFDFSPTPEGGVFSLRIKSTGSPSGTEFEGAVVITASADSDSDDLPDPWEERWAGAGNLSALSGLAGANADSDSLTDLEEYNLRDQFPDLDPTKRDSDDDTLEDGAEIDGAGLRPPTDPTNPDTDNDSLTDGVETNTGSFNGPSDTGTNPTLVDTDEDTFSDSLEVTGGSDPNKADSTPAVTLVGYWPFDGDTNPQPDLSDFANNATVATGASWVNDPERGGVMEFDGNDSYLEAADSDSLSLTNDLTLAAWVNATDYNNYRGILGKTAGAGGHLPAAYDLYLFNGSGVPRLFAGASAGAIGSADALTAPTAGEWHHIAVSKIGSEVFFYFDGLPDGQGTIDAELEDSDTPLKIGNRHDLFVDFFGRLDDVAIFNGGLSADQVAAIKDGDFSEFGIGSSGFAITNIAYIENYRDSGDPAVSLTFNSRPGKEYAIDFSTNLYAEGEPGGWAELQDGIVADDSTTIFVDTIVAGNTPTLFYRVREN
jgi:hypothetical protein|tara:strand:+ start:497 stop:2791 length:2295 start_codon:yes stop_codon:yes gene_type:complete